VLVVLPLCHRPSIWECRLRAGQSSSTATGEFAGLAVAYGRSGWKARYGSLSFGPSGWAVTGWNEEGADGNNNNNNHNAGMSRIFV